MFITVLGSGGVGRALAARFSQLGHEVNLGTRQPGRPDLADWAADHPHVQVVPVATSCEDPDVVVIAVPGDAVADTLAQADPPEGTVCLDVSNPLDFSNGFPPTLFVCNTESLAERTQAAFPHLYVVKALNTMNVDVMVAPRAVGGGAHTAFVAGNDGDSRIVVTALLRELGHVDVLDLGDLSAARGLEMYLPLWLCIMGTLGTASFNVRVVR